MSAWRIAVQALHALGGTATARDIWVSGRMGGGVKSALYKAKAMGLVTSPGYCGRDHAGAWVLTQRGVDFCEGRLAFAPGVPQSTGGRPPMRLVCTWLSALPRNVRIEVRA